MKKNPIIIAYAGANLSSLQFALKRVGYDVSITSSHNKIRNASHIFLPGVGAAASAMGKIKDNFLIDTLVNAKQPTLGICLGMQLLFTSSDEGSAECLDIINGNAQIFEANKNMPVPHMGWNKIKCISESRITKNINDKEFAYFVHSYSLPECQYTIATTDYGKTFSSIVEKDNFFGTQFHPERSSDFGEMILKNFLDID